MFITEPLVADGGTPRAGRVGVQEAVAVIADSDSAMRELMRRTVEGAGFVVLESASAPELELTLQLRMVINAPRALLVVSATLMPQAGGAFTSLARQRTAQSRVLPHVILTCEFGALAETPGLDLSECIPVGILEKPFDFAVLEGTANRCRAFPAGIQFIMSTH